MTVTEKLPLDYPAEETSAVTLISFFLLFIIIVIGAEEAD